MIYNLNELGKDIVNYMEDKKRHFKDKEVIKK